MLPILILMIIIGAVTVFVLVLLAIVIVGIRQKRRLFMRNQLLATLRGRTFCGR